MGLEKIGTVGGWDHFEFEERPEPVRLEVPARPVALELQVPILERPAPPKRLYPPGDDQAGPLRRLSPRKSWPDVQEFDRRLDNLDQRRVRLGEDVARLEQAVREAHVADKMAVADWQLAGEKGERPVAKVPALEAELEQVRSDIESTTIAEDTILKEKTEFVSKHRKRLKADAAKSRREAVATLKEKLADAEAAREEVLEAMRAERWAQRFPSEEANADVLGLQLMRGGRTSKAIPELKTITTAAKVFAYLHDDADWLDKALADPAERALDPHEKPIWEETKEGREAMALANQRVDQHAST